MSTPLATIPTLFMQLLNAVFTLLLPILATLVILLWIPTLIVAFIL